jgi:hypothetical protein
MREIKGDLLKGEGWDVFCHCVNNYHVFGSGIAWQILNVFPEMYQADCETEHGCDSKLGTFSKAELPDGRVGYNLYAMHGLGNNGMPLDRNLSYDSFYDGMTRIIEDFIVEHLPIDGKGIIGVPRKIGCDRAGGSWSIVEAILQELETRYDTIEFLIYDYNG